MTLPSLRQNKNIPFLYDFPDYMRDPLAFLLSVGHSANLMRVRFTSLREFWVATDPDFFQHVLQAKPKNYIRERTTMRVHRSGRDAYSFNTEDWDDWLWRRRLMQPAFHKQALTRFCDVMVSEASRIVHEWSGDVDLERAMKTLTMRIIGKTMFSFEFTDEIDMLADAYDVWGKYIFLWASLGVNPPAWLPLPVNIRTRRAIQNREKILKTILMSRHKSQQPQHDLLDMLLSAKLDEGHQFTADQLVLELDGIVFAGHDTTAMTLTWIFYHLAQNPQIEEKLRAEIGQVLGDRLPTLEDIEHMPYTQMVIQEALRLYPPVYVTVRENLEADNWQGYSIPARTSVLLNMFGLQRHPDLWAYPDQFNPENFSPGNSEHRHRFAFQPFISGPRKCMGDTFAMMEMQLVIPTILQQTRLRFAGGHAVMPRPAFVLHPAERIVMQAERSTRREPVPVAT